ncbi:hypothetical protein Y1Q_0002106 [Alligator mississippiensis]|uniref:Uncharacterized protein n=1 Tax=Alligator mississippiensis TaxID=8496 RepID=A0A151MIY8_ALLMI|nr:hypothetical protein Y1Q_0002106 [Alligator mississippiensis]
MGQIWPTKPLDQLVDLGLWWHSAARGLRGRLVPFVQCIIYQTGGIYKNQMNTSGFGQRKLDQNHRKAALERTSGVHLVQASAQVGGELD